MTTLYTVQCNFGRPELEDEWNSWYNGPKTAHMLAKPLFLQCQRFAAHALDMDVRYLAMWELESPAALKTPEYQATWGWDRWAPMIGDWVRDLSRSADPDARVPYPAQGADPVFVHLAWFAADVNTVRARLTVNPEALAEWWWGSCDGLDQSAGTIAVRSIATGASAPERAFADLALRETIYRSVSPLTTARTEQEAGA